MCVRQSNSGGNSGRHASNGAEAIQPAADRARVTAVSLPAPLPLPLQKDEQSNALVGLLAGRDEAMAGAVHRNAM